MDQVRQPVVAAALPFRPDLTVRLTIGLAAPRPWPARTPLIGSAPLLVAGQVRPWLTYSAGTRPDPPAWYPASARRAHGLAACRGRNRRSGRRSGEDRQRAGLGGQADRALSR